MRATSLPPGVPDVNRESHHTGVDGVERLWALATRLHGEFQSLGLFEAYGDMCLVMALALGKVFAFEGIAAPVRFCNLVIAHSQGAFLLGFEKHGKKVPDELIDTHAVCIVDNCLLVDFGLGQVRKAWQVPTYDGAIACCHPRSEVLATHLVDGCAYVWLAQPRSNPRVRAATPGNMALAQSIFERWRDARNAPRCRSVPEVSLAT